LDAFIAALITNIVTIIVMFLLASCLRKRYPLVYSKQCITLKDDDSIKPLMDDVQNGDDQALKDYLNEDWTAKIGSCLTNDAGVSVPASDSFFGWWSASAAVTIDDVAEARGLDIAMLLEFSHVAMKITATVGLPLVLLVGPCHCFLGGYRAGAPGTADADYLSYWGMANVVDGHPWLYWLHAMVVWLVCITVQRMLFNAMRDFMKRRKKWLMEMPTMRATTVLVEGIPDETRSDKELKKYFDDIFGKPGTVAKAYVVKYSSGLVKATKEREFQRAFAKLFGQS